MKEKDISLLQRTQKSQTLNIVALIKSLCKQLVDDLNAAVEQYIPFPFQMNFILTEPNEIMHTKSLSAKTLFIHLLIYWFYEDWLLQHSVLGPVL